MIEHDERIELTILMPCLDEEETIEKCIRRASAFLQRTGISGEVVVADNGSTDGSAEIAAGLGARVVSVSERGYGAALKAGTAAARGTYVVMGDADDSYDFSALDGFVAKLREGYSLVIGDRFAGGIMPGAMPFLHRYLGNPILSFLGRLFFHSKVRDFHCGLRGYRREDVLRMSLSCTGMEYASEMIVKAEIHGLRIAQVPTVLHKDGRSRPPHLRSWRDGWRHLRFLLIHSPNWLFLYPGLALMIVGAAADLLLMRGTVRIGAVSFDIQTMLYFSSFFLIGMQLVSFGVFTHYYNHVNNLLPEGKGMERFLDRLSLEGVLAAGLFLVAAGIAMTVVSFVIWKNRAFGELNPMVTMRYTIPGVLLLMGGIQLVFSSFMIAVLKIKKA